MSFNTRLSDRAKRINSYLCVGIDISPELLGSDKLEDLVAHSKLVVDATRDIALAFKPNFAFFERWGSKGFKWLEETVEYIGSDCIIIADAKRGDIGSTSEAYANAWLGDNSHFYADALTVNPWMGLETIYPFIKIAKEKGKGVFILLKTSNLGSKDIQSLEAVS